MIWGYPYFRKPPYDTRLEFAAAGCFLQFPTLFNFLALPLERHSGEVCEIRYFQMGVMKKRVKDGTHQGVYPLVMKDGWEVFHTWRFEGGNQF